MKTRLQTIGRIGRIRWQQVVLAIGAFGIANVAFADTAPAAAAQATKLAIETCSECHGPGGRATKPTFPVLAAQNRDYLVAQLTAFREHTRGEPAAHDYMYGMARALDDATVHALASYFAEQKPIAGRSADTALIARGKALFDQGDEKRALVACAACHGADARGNGPIPRLAGQHADYVVKQLTVIQNALRSVPAMHGIIQKLAPDEMAALAAYVQSRD